MKRIFLIILFLISNSMVSQEIGNENEFRKVEGVVNNYVIPEEGLLVSYVGLKYAVSTDSEGRFCLTVPKYKSVFIKVPICRTHGIFEIKPSDNFVKFIVSSSNDRSDYMMASEKKWNESKEELLPELKKIYSSSEYEIANLKNCWN